MKLGKMPKAGDVILAKIDFADSLESKRRPALILFQELNNIVVAGITSNKNMKGIKLSEKEGAVRESVIKLNYIFTISENRVNKKLFSLSKDKKREVVLELNKKLEVLN